MTNKIKEITTWVFIALVFFLNLIPVVDWFMNSEMTRMQIFKKWWALELFILLVCVLFISLRKNKKNKIENGPKR